MREHPREVTSLVGADYSLAVTFTGANPRKGYMWAIRVGREIHAVEPCFFAFIMFFVVSKTVRDTTDFIP